MATPVIKRKQIIDSAVTALDATAGPGDGEYINTFNVSKKIVPYQKVPRDQMPWVSVFGGRGGTTNPNASSRAQQDMTLGVLAYVVWDGVKDMTTIEEEAIGDIEKALGQDPTRGVSAIMIRRDIEIARFIDEEFSIIAIDTQYQFRRGLSE